jgi:Leucine-rich repeat (LRR) protein
MKKFELQVKVSVDEKNKKSISKCQKLKVVCGCEIIVILLLALFMTFSLFFIYVNYVIRGVAEGYVFFALGTAYCFLVASFIFRVIKAIFFPNGEEKHKDKTWKVNPLHAQKEKKVVSIDKTAEEPGVVSNNHSKLVHCLFLFKRWYLNVFDVNGKYYLVKMYMAEFFEHIQQIYCILFIHVCLMSVKLTLFICIVVSVELAVNLIVTFKLDSQVKRDRLIFLDLFTDIFLLSFPLMYSWLSVQIPVSIADMYAIIIYPSISIFLKFIDIWEDFLQIDLQRVNIKNTNQLGTQRSRKRRSVLSLSHNKKVIEEQLEQFPLLLRYIFSAINAFFLIFFVGLGCFHLLNKPSTAACNNIYTKSVWEDGCLVEVPFCQNPLIAKCDCAVLTITNYSQAKLPDSFGNLSSLIKLGIYFSKIEKLPDNFGNNHKKIISLWAVNNKLKYLPETIGNLKSLMSLYVWNNHIKSLPNSIGNLKSMLYFYAWNNELSSLPSSIGGMEKLLNLWLFNNKLKSLPSSIGDLKYLDSLYVFNNRLTSLPNSIGAMDGLRRLWISNNQVSTLPDNILKLKQLNFLFAWNNTLKNLPTNLGNLESLNRADFRHNNLIDLPSTANKLHQIEYFYLAGNPICGENHFEQNLPRNLKNTANAICERQCSIDCPSVMLLQDGCDGCINFGCDDNDYNYYYVEEYYKMPFSVEPKGNSGCNTKKCDFDKGLCPAK